MSCWYTGTLEDGTVFDTNVVTGGLWPGAISLHSESYDLAFVLMSISSPHTAAKKKKQAKPLSFKVGMGKVIKGVSPAVALLLLVSFHQVASMLMVMCFTVGRGSSDNEQG